MTVKSDSETFFAAIILWIERFVVTLLTLKASCEGVLKVLKVSTSSQILALSDERWDFIFMTIDIYTASAYYKPPEKSY